MVRDGSAATPLSLGGRIVRGLCLAPHFRGKSRLEDALLARVATPAGVTRHPLGFSLEVDGGNSFEVTSIFRDAEPDTARFFRTAVHPEMTVYDCGANVGFYTLLFATLVGDLGRVVAWEPTPYLAGRVRTNLTLNRLTNVDLRESAVSAEEGKRSVYGFDGDNHGRNTLAPDAASTELASCRTESIDGLVAAGRIPPPDFMKLDIEGAELDALRGGATTIEANRPTLVVELCHSTSARFGHTPAEVIEFLFSLGDWEILWLKGRTPTRVDPRAPLPHEAIFGQAHGWNYAFVPR